MIGPSWRQMIDGWARECKREVLVQQRNFVSDIKRDTHGNHPFVNRVLVQDCDEKIAYIDQALAKLPYFAQGSIGNAPAWPGSAA